MKENRCFSCDKSMTYDMPYTCENFFSTRKKFKPQAISKTSVFKTKRRLNLEE